MSKKSKLSILIKDKKVVLYNVFNKYYYKFFSYSLINVVEKFKLYTPSSRVTKANNFSFSVLTIKNILNIFNSINSLLLFDEKKPILYDVIDFYKNKKNNIIEENIEIFKRLFNGYKSDKADKSHNYHYIYSIILEKRNEIKYILEIGVGTKNLTITSNMGINGVPGASLRAFREFLPNAQIFGADIDKDILFTEERIKTFYLDQTDPSTFDELDKIIPNELDLVIDDGLHSTDANINSLLFGLKKVKVGGWVFIEDITLDKLKFWEVIDIYLSKKHETYLIYTNVKLVYLLRKR